FVLPGEDKVDEQQCQCEYDIHLTADQLLLIRHRAPFEASAGRKGATDNLLHQRQCLAGRDSLCRQADDRRRWTEIIQADEGGTDSRRDLYEGTSGIICPSLLRTNMFSMSSSRTRDCESACT